jgi:hypothetical protein
MPALVHNQSRKRCHADNKAFPPRFSLNIKEDLVHLENFVKKKRKRMTKEQSEEEYKGWISDSRFSRTRDTRIFRITKLYWLNISFISQW